MLKPTAQVLTKDTRPEVELLLCCARTHVDAERAARITALLQEDIDWTYLIRTALRHGIMPLLYRTLKNTCPEAVPEAILDQLQNFFRNNTRHNFFLAAELLRLLRMLEDHDIVAIPYKGPVLAEAIYGDLALRQFGDLDILVRKQDVLKAKDLLISIGYRLSFHLNAAQETAFLRSQFETSFFHEDSKVTVDLHWGITSQGFSFPLALDRVWERLESTSLLDVVVPSFSPEDLLLILCVHGTKHCWVRLGWICDIAELVRVHQEIAWGQVMEQAESLNSARMFLLGLFLADALLGAAIPKTVLQKAQADPTIVALTTQVCDRLFRDMHDLPGMIEHHLFLLRARERVGDGLRYLFSLMIAPTIIEWTLLPLPPFLSFLYYLLRPIRLTIKYGKRLLKRFLGIR